MATTTPNFGWDIPQSTDLVKDGATAIAALGNDIDTSMVDLKGGTTGQILSKASNTDMDFTWTSANPGDITGVTAGTGLTGGGTSGDVTITNSMATAIDAKGDLIVGTGADTFSRLAVGSNNQILTADSSTATGLKWAAAGVSKSWSLISSASLSGASTITISGISGKDDLFIVAQGASAGADAEFTIRFNSDSGANYIYITPEVSGNSTYAAGNFSSNWYSNATNIFIARASSNAGSASGLALKVSGATSSGLKFFNGNGSATTSTSNAQRLLWPMGHWTGTAAISSVSLISSSGNFDAGTLYVYGA